jgi:hypothetical protein
MSLNVFRRPSPRVLVFTDEERQLIRDALHAADEDRKLLRRALERVQPTDVGETPVRRALMRWGKLAGGLIAVVSLGLVAWQAVEASSSARASADAVKATAWAAATEAVMTYDQAVLQTDPNGKLDPYFMDRELLDDDTPHAQRSRITQLGLMQLDLLDGYRGFAALLPGFVDQESVRGWHELTLSRGPALCQVLHEYRLSYAADFVRDSAAYCPSNLLPVSAHDR